MQTASDTFPKAGPIVVSEPVSVSDLVPAPANQLRAARALLRMKPKDLAEASGISTAAVVRAEAEDGALQVTRANLTALLRTLEDAGVEFLAADATGGPGVRPRKPGETGSGQ
jgi:hypothetical protein